MPRSPASLPEGSRITDYISLGVVATTFPRSLVDQVLADTGRASRRVRDLPAYVVVYYVIAMALYMQVSYREVLRCLLEGVEWLFGARARVAGRSAISQARSRLGSEPIRELHDRVVRPIAVERTKGAWFRRWRLVSLDGSTLMVPDSVENEQAFGRPGGSRGKVAYPQVRMVSLVENGTHVLFSSVLGAYRVGEVTLAKQAVAGLVPGMLCIADRNFFGYPLWSLAQARGCDLLWRAKCGMVLECERVLEDGSYLSHLYRRSEDRRRRVRGTPVRVVEYTLDGVPDAEPLYRLVTTILDPGEAPARELAALYHERWEIETCLDELKTHVRGAGVVLRSRTPELVRQEIYGLLMAHFAVRGLMHEAALKADVDPDNLSFIHAVRVVRRKLPRFVASPP